ncbi:MAG: hypothetical protein U9N02_07880 [Campylobacterota bacterium]|nr:hypothetical protein [Campylobacterota bacterium]
MSSLSIASVNNTYKITKSGGKKRYILLRPIYITNNATYKNGFKDF